MTLRRGTLLFLLLAVAIALPPYCGTYYTRFATQIAIYGMAALSVDLLLGYSGLITFGQAALFGVGAYAAGMLTVYGLTDALVTWPLAVLVSMLFALAIGALSLRTRGFQFIMVTLAFAQMVYYFAQSCAIGAATTASPCPSAIVWGSFRSPIIRPSITSCSRCWCWSCCSRTGSSGPSSAW